MKVSYLIWISGSGKMTETERNVSQETSYLVLGCKKTADDTDVQDSQISGNQHDPPRSYSEHIACCVDYNFLDHVSQRALRYKISHPVVIQGNQVAL